MRLFDFERAPNPRRVHIFMAEKGIEIPRIHVDLYRRQQLTPEFRAINPGYTVPVLETDDGTHICESIAICRYLEALHPEPRLFGCGAKCPQLVDRGKVRHSNLLAQFMPHNHYLK